MDRTREMAPRGYGEFLGPRRPLTWVRTPLYDREYELARLNTNGGAGDGVGGRLANSDPDLSSSFEQRVKRRNTIPTSPLANYIRNLLLKPHSYEPAATGDAEAPPDELPLKRSSTRKRPAKRWNMMRFVVGGQQFQCPEWIFEGHPDTLLGNAQNRENFYHVKRKSYIFPHILPDVFTAVLEYYQVGVLTRPERLTLNYFLEQLELFALEPTAIDQLLKSQGVHGTRCHDATAACSEEKPTFRSRLWHVLEYPCSSRLARVYCNISLFLTVLSVVLYVVETLPELKRYSLVGRRCLSEAFSSPLTIVNAICFTFFTVEFLSRFLTCPSKGAFLRRWTNWTDLLSILPYLIVILLLAVHYDDHHVMPVSVLNTLRGCRLFMVTRVLGTSRFYRQHWITILVQTLWNNMGTLFVLFFLMIICMVGFGGVIYALEGVGQESPTFVTIPMGMWWAVMTLTTVGYGDVVPKRALGQITAIVCGCVGLMFIGFVLESVTYEYHRLMKSNSQYLRYRSELAFRQRPKPSLDLPEKPLPRVTSCRASLSNLAADNEVVVSINGAEFIFTLNDLNQHPNSLLGHPSKRAPYFNPTTGSYFFPRNQDIFPTIHHYYRHPGTVLSRPPFITMQRFVEEIEFFQLRPQAVIDFFASEGIRLVDEKEPRNIRLRYWHLVLEHPQFNLLASVISLLSMLATASFTVMVILESLPSILDPSCSTALAAAVPGSNHSEGPSVSFSELCRPELAFFVVETVCTLYFLLELVARFIVAPSKRKFLKRLMNWVDVLVIIPYAFTLIQLTSFASPSELKSQLFGFFRTMRLLRLISILKFARYFKRLQMIFAILQSTWSELLMLCYFMLINSVIFGTLVYVIETNTDGPFDSIPRGMYWSWVTMLTIGYGDLIPESPGGKVVGAGCAILGIVFWTLPMTLISDHFANYRRLYEGKEYLMKCLTRMYHLRDRDLGTKRGPGKVASTMTEPELLCVSNETAHDHRDGRDTSPRGHLLPSRSSSRDHRRPHSRLSRNPSRLSVSPANLTTSQILEETAGPKHFSRLEYDSGLSASKFNGGSTVTIGLAPSESLRDIVVG
ncbi:Potassium voltage-gated channel subfamily A member 3 [Hypsibius exemplaris]|uniref:Potassium voltage-gated channel subfamily A member 3 n=1 Tax=Hypsibius exemplaris TaxID=2072580 RepID=A0A1W0XE55_HYPEX|nr:Potassium voltage-gated channel subfamily A member 3 [Hypsibius exemplaris]